LLNLHETITRN